MPNRKDLKSVGLDALTIQARAGVVPGSDHTRAGMDLRVARIARTVSAYTSHGSRSHETRDYRHPQGSSALL